MRTLRALPLLITAPMLLNCGEGLPDFVPPVALECNGLAMQTVDQAIAPPANVAALVRVTRCGGLTLEDRLTTDNFTLAEDGAELSEFEAARNIVSTERDVREMTVVVLDMSGSISRAGLRTEMVDGARALVQRLAGERQIAIYGFDGRADLAPFTYFTDDETELMLALERIENAPVVDDSTNLFGAVVNALAILDEALDSPNRDIYQITHGSLVLFTDGTDRAGRVDYETAELAVRNSPHSTFTIGIGAEIDKDILASFGRSASLIVDDADEIVEAFDKVAMEVEAQSFRDYIVSYCSPARAGAHVLKITAQSGELKGSVELTFNAGNFGAGCDPEVSLLK